MEFRRAVEADINHILNIIHQAQEYLKEAGIDQWQNGYPDMETIKRDIENKHGYVLSNAGKIAGTIAVSFDGEKTYNDIYEGVWLTPDRYAVIHRLAVDGSLKGTGLASLMINEAEKICRRKTVSGIRVDTNEKNISMQRLLKKNGFAYCGIIYLEDRSKRLAFEKILRQEN